MSLVTSMKAGNRRDTGRLVRPHVGLLWGLLGCCCLPSPPAPLPSALAPPFLKDPWGSQGFYATVVAVSLQSKSAEKRTMLLSFCFCSLPPLPATPVFYKVLQRRDSQLHDSQDSVKGLTHPLSVLADPSTALQVPAPETNMHPSKYGAIILKLQVNADFISLLTKTNSRLINSVPTMSTYAQFIHATL